MKQIYVLIYAFIVVIYSMDYNNDKQFVHCKNVQPKWIRTIILYTRHIVYI